MEAADLGEVVAIEAASALLPWSRDTFARELEIPFSRALVASVGGPPHVVGFVVWWRVAGEVHLLNLAVAPDHRGAGIGRGLLAAVLADASAGGGSCVALEVAETNHAALRLYRSVGFAVVGRRPDYYGPGSPAVLMSCRVAPA